MLDLLIIGGSAAGCSAGIYAARRNLNFKIVADNVGGEMALSGQVENWPGIKQIQGFELAQQFAEHVKSYNVEIDEGWRVDSVSKRENYFIATAKNAKNEEKTFEAKAIISATGIHPRHLKVPGEEELSHKGVTYCTVCDGPLFKNKTTATIGGGNSALESAIMMAGIAKKVYILTIEPNTPENKSGFPSGEDILIEKIKSLPNIEILNEANTYEIFGESKVQGLRYRDTKGEHELLVDGIMVHVGMIPNSQFIDVEKDKFGQIIISQKCETNIPGLFAAGDVTNLPFKQIGIAAGQGITAALSAIEYINKWKK
ncbi:MAG: FAD-dependent oxidoreductase [Candidatus Magasanikbacteria bacterium]|nr:FAD-dependent oxidoreductase [Candidatus Magasanikbacteria bacterium]